MYLLITTFFLPLIGIVYLHTKLKENKLSQQLFNDNPITVKSLLQQNADPNYIDQTRTQLNTPLCHAVFNRNLTIIKLLLEYKANINQSDSNGDSPLMLGIYHPRCIQLLLENKADVRYTKKGHNPLSIAKKNNSPSTVLLKDAEEKHFQEIRRIVYFSLFNKSNTRKGESFKKLSELPLFDINLVEKEILSFLQPR
jgi:ankyrin repeat protein